jgi:hypothetical protein
VLNLDTIAIREAGAPVAIIGRGHPALDAIVDTVAKEQGRTVDSDREADAFVQRQDGWEFAKRGVPAIMAGGSFSDLKIMEQFLSGSYHGPDDAVTPALMLDGAAEDASLHVAVGRALADPARYPGPEGRP